MALQWRTMTHGIDTAGPSYQWAWVGSQHKLILVQVSETVHRADVCEPENGAVIHSFGDFFDGADDAKRLLEKAVPKWEDTLDV